MGSWLNGGSGFDYSGFFFSICVRTGIPIAILYIANGRWAATGQITASGRLN